MDFNNDIEDLCDKLRLCLLVTEDDEPEKNTGILVSINISFLLLHFL